MKHIRTKDGIIDLSKVTIGENGWKNIEEYIAFKQEEQKELIKVADTIEELCDRFVYDEDVYYPKIVNGCLQTYDYEANDLEITKEMIKKGIYGAIWTDKGLIYVAKMNDKGELESL